MEQSSHIQNTLYEEGRQRGLVDSRGCGKEEGSDNMPWDMTKKEGDQNGPTELERCQRVCDGNEHNHQTYTT